MTVTCELLRRRVCPQLRLAMRESLPMAREHAVLGTVQPCRQFIEACAAFEQATTRMLGFEAACLIVATLCGRLQATFDRRAAALFVLVQRTEPVADVRRHPLGRRGPARPAQAGGQPGHPPTNP